MKRTFSLTHFTHALSTSFNIKQLKRMQKLLLLQMLQYYAVKILQHSLTKSPVLLR